MRIRGFLLAVLVTALAVPAAASADTTIGITTKPTGSTSNPCPPGPSPPANEIVFDYAGGSSLTGPLSVPSSTTQLAVTHWAINAAGVTTNEPVTLVVFRITLMPTPVITIVATDPETVTPPASPAANIEQFTPSQPMVVQTGDFISQYAPGATPGLTCYWSGAPGETNTVEGFVESSPPTVGQQLSPSGSGLNAPNAELNLSATLAPPSSDAALSLSTGPSNAVVGQPAVLTASVTNKGPQAAAVTFTDPVPSGLTVDYAAAASGSCTTSAVNIVTCPLSSVPVGQSTKVAIVVTPKSAQSYSDSATVSLTGGGTDPNLANNVATTTLHVSKVGAPTGCAVPKLGGASLAIAKRVLPLLGCKVGKVKKAKSKTVPKGEVISTNPHAGTYPVGKKIAITVSSGKGKK